ncbi:hypothetical protein Q8A73_017679 [Channa argus]|nr:hypothetical protein Q8A73_017679 [Channa argus]
MEQGVSLSTSLTSMHTLHTHAAHASPPEGYSTWIRASAESNACQKYTVTHKVKENEVTYMHHSAANPAWQALGLYDTGFCLNYLFLSSVHALQFVCTCPAASQDIGVILLLRLHPDVVNLTSLTASLSPPQQLPLVNVALQQLRTKGGVRNHV